MLNQGGAGAQQAQHGLSGTLGRNGDAAGGGLIACVKPRLIETERIGVTPVDEGVLVVPRTYPCLLLEGSVGERESRGDRLLHARDIEDCARCPIAPSARDVVLALR